MQQRRGTAAQWLSTNAGNGPILSPGEIGFESDTNKFKIGDGVNHWIDLAYFVDEDSATGGGGAISVQQVNAAGSPVESYTNITTIQFDEDSGFDVTNPATGTAKIAMNSTFKFWEVDGTQQLTAVGLDTVNFISGTGIDISADGSADPQSIIIAADLSGLATEAYVDNAVSGVTVDLSTSAGVGLDWNATTSQIDIDSTVATKSYVNAVAQGLDVKQSVYAATADFEHIDLTTWNANSGVIGNVGPGFNRVLLKNQNTWSENGIYAADPTTGFLVRTPDGIVNTTLTKGSFVFVEAGTNAGKGFVVSDIQEWTNNGVIWSLFSASPGLPNQNGNSGKYLTTDGTTPYWSTVSGSGTAAESIHPFAMIG